MPEKTSERPNNIPICSACFDFTPDGNKFEKRTIVIAPIVSEAIGEGIWKTAWACIPQNHLICTPYGERAIDHIKEGGMVCSYDFATKSVVSTKVVKIFKRHYVGKITKIKPYRLTTLRLTPEHPILIRIYHHIITKNNYRTVISEPHWLNSDTVIWLTNIFRRNYGICVGLPFSDEEIDQEELDEEKLFLLGWYIAEGDIEFRHSGSRIKPTRVRFTLNVDENDIAEKIQDLTKKHFGANSNNKVIVDKRNGNKYRRLRIYSVKFAKFIRKWCQGRKARVKKFNQKVLTLPKQKQLILLDAMFQGDGYKFIHKKTPTSSWSSASRKLAHQVLIMSIRLRKCMGFSELMVKGGYRKEKKPTYTVSYFEGKGKNRRFLMFEDNILWTPISKITSESFDGFVYNLETEKHNYISSFLVHNCNRAKWCKDRECLYSKSSSRNDESKGESPFWDEGKR